MERLLLTRGRGDSQGSCPAGRQLKNREINKITLVDEFGFSKHLSANPS